MDDLLDQVRNWVDTLTDPAAGWQLAVIFLCSLASWGLIRWGKSRLAKSAADHLDAAPKRSLARVAGLADVLWPLLASLLLVISARIGDARHHPTDLLRIALFLLFASGAIRLLLYAVRRVFKPSGMLHLLQRAITAIAWTLVVLHVFGLLGYVADALESVRVYQLNGTAEEINLLQILQGSFWVALTLVLALWIGTVLESRLMRMSSLDASLQVALGRFGRALLVVIAVLVSMQIVGIPLGVLSVFGGALGVGLGLGLQRIASNYVSGFIILLDRSIRIGDLIAVDKYTGAVSQIRTRYTVVKALDGTEAILPNELLVSSPVLNHSYTSRQTRVSLKLQIAYASKVDAAMRIMIAAAKAQERVLVEPAPVALATAFAPDGLELELGFWIGDPEIGTGGVRSEIHLAILRGFIAENIAFPTARREIHVEYAAQAGPSDK